MSERQRKGPGDRADVERQDSTGLEVPSGRKASEVAPEEVRPARGVEGEREEDGRRRDEAGERVVATVHADASPADAGRSTRPIGNTDEPVNSRDPDAP
jgi:hypothetical protein